MAHFDIDFTGCVVRELFLEALLAERYCNSCHQKAGDFCPLCRGQVTAKLRLFFPGEVLPVAAVAPPPVVHVEEARAQRFADGLVALADVAHADAERLSDVEAVEKWMLTFADDLDGMPIEDALDFLDVFISEERAYKE